ncbi:MAG: glycosyltransferase [Paludibacter sp.]|nr:glycosyltransferase [Paludibacter sp.]
MFWMYFVTILICSLYLCLILIFQYGWKQMKAFVPKGDELINTKISVVVACKNEEKHVLQLIGCLAQQSIQNYELIFVNDHSKDATRNYIKIAQQTFSKIQLIDATGFGKKNALKEGILKSTGELIITTDADCMPSYYWVETIACFYKKYKCDLIICPVRLSERKNLFSKLQELEFTSLIASAAGAAGAGMPVLCNGANLAFTKNAWLDAREDLHEEEQSGDDMFLLESVKKRKGNIRFLKSESAFVITEQPESLVQFIKQRRRWTSKSTAYKDWQIIGAACIVLLINLLPLVLLSLSFINSTYIIIFGSLFLIKYILDTTFLYTVRIFFQLDKIWFYSFILSLIYPFYIVYVAFSSLLIKPSNWK